MKKITGAQDNKKLFFRCLVLVDGIILMMSIYWSFLMRGHAVHCCTHWGSLTALSLVYVCICALSFSLVGLYRIDVIQHVHQQFLRLTSGFVCLAMITIILAYVFPAYDLGLTIWLTVILVSFFSVVCVRLLLCRCIKGAAKRKRVLVLGSGQKALKLKASLMKHAIECDVIGFIHLRGERARVEFCAVLSSLSSLLDYAKQHHVCEIVVAIDDRRNGFPLEQLLNCRLAGIVVIDLLQFYEQALGQIKLDILDPSWLIFSHGFTQDDVQTILKRAVDIIVSCVAIMLTIPIVSLLIVFIKCSLPKKSSYAVARHVNGLAGNDFMCREYALSQSNAPMRLARRYGLHKLAMLWHVLKGDMSLVGPAAVPSGLTLQDAKLATYFAERHRVKPGLLGWAQQYLVCADDNVAEQLPYDLYYIKNYSLQLDASIVLMALINIFKPTKRSKDIQLTHLLSDDNPGRA